MSRDDDRSERRRGRDDDDRGSRRDRDDDRGSRSRDRDDDRGSRRGREDDRSERRGRDRDDDDRGSRSGRSFTYQQRDAADARKRTEQSGRGDFDRLLKDGVKMWKPNDGDNRIRILPPTWEGAKHYGLDIFVHYGVGPDRGSYLCLQKMLDKPDPIAEEHAEARRDGDDEYAKEIEAKKRVLVYLIDRDNEKEGVQAWAMPWTVDRDIMAVSIDKSSGEVLPIDHPEEGYDVSFEKTGSKDRTKYIGIQIARRSSPLGKKAWLEYAMDNPLPDQLLYFSYEHIAKAFGGGSSKDRGRDDREDDRDRGRGDSRSRDRDDDRGGRRRDEPKLDWDAIHGMTGRELEDLIDEQKLDIDPADAKDDEDLADWICEEMKITKQERRSERDEPEDRVERRRTRDSDDDDRPSDRLRRMREGRE